jgi:hypothetical protein
LTPWTIRSPTPVAVDTMAGFPIPMPSATAIENVSSSDGNTWQSIS